MNTWRRKSSCSNCVIAHTWPNSQTNQRGRSACETMDYRGRQTGTSREKRMEALPKEDRQVPLLSAQSDELQAAETIIWDMWEADKISWKLPAQIKQEPATRSKEDCVARFWRRGNFCSARGCRRMRARA